MKRRLRSRSSFGSAPMFALTLLPALLTAALPARPQQPAAPQKLPGGRMAFTLKSGSFSHQEPIPKSFTCDGTDMSPALSWTDPPQGTRSLALIMDDPDAPGGTFVHWVLYDIPADARKLPQAVPPNEEVIGGAKQGRNGFGKTGYGGPCPPAGKPHHYHFKLFALSKTLGLRAGMTRDQLLAAMQDAILGNAELVGTYGRTRS